jgi:hypothetical protein
VGFSSNVLIRTVVGLILAYKNAPSL